MSERYYCDLPIQGDRATLAGSEAHHLVHVMRVSAGEQLTLFDGSGMEFRAEVIAAGRSDVELAILDRQPIDRELPFELTIAVALPKGDRQKWLVEKLTELGVSRLVPLVAERGVAQPTASAVSRLQRTVVEACKQCGRNRLMEITPAARWEEHVHAEASARRWVAHPSGIDFGELRREPVRSVAVAVGPEGGFSDQEIEFARNAGWQEVSLGSRILRVETAAVAVAAAIVLAK